MSNPNHVMSTTRQIPCSILTTPLRGMEALDSFNSNVATSRQGRWQLRSLSRTLEHTHTEYFCCGVDGASLDCVQDKVQMRRPGPSPAPPPPTESPSLLRPFLPAPLSLMHAHTGQQNNNSGLRARPIMNAISYRKWVGVSRMCGVKGRYAADAERKGCVDAA